MTTNEGLKLEFDLEQFNFEESNTDNKDDNLLDKDDTEEELKQNTNINKELISLNDTHVLTNDQDLSTLGDYVIQKVATSAQITLIIIKSVVNGVQNLRLLRYDQTYRTTEYNKWFEIIEIPLKSQDQNAIISQLFISPHGSYGFISFDTGLFMCLHTNNKTKIQKSQLIVLNKENVFPREPVTVIAFDRKVDDINITGDLLIGTNFGNIYCTHLQKIDKQIKILSQSIKLIHTLPLGHSITGLSFDYFDIDQRLQQISQQLGSSPCSQQLNQQDLPINFLPANALNMYTQFTMKCFQILVSSQFGVRLITGRGASVSDVLLAANDRTAGSPLSLQSDYQVRGRPEKYQFTSQVPIGEILNLPNACSFRYENQKLVSWSWFALQHFSANEKVYEDIIYSDQTELQELLDDGWEIDETDEIQQHSAREMFSKVHNITQQAVGLYIGRFPPDLLKLFNGSFGIFGNEDKIEGLTSSQFLKAEQEYDFMVSEYSVTQSIMDPAVIQEVVPNCLINARFQFLAVYNNQLICINQITQEFSAKISFEELFTSLVKSNDGLINFNDHTRHINTQQNIIGLCSDCEQKHTLIYTEKTLYQLDFNDQKDLWREYVSKRKFIEALDYCENTKQRNEVKYHQAIHLIQEQRFNEAASLLGQTPRQVEDVILKFITDICNPEFSLIRMGTGRQQQNIYLNREAIISYCESYLQNMNVNLINDKYKDAKSKLADAVKTQKIKTYIQFQQLLQTPVFATHYNNYLLFNQVVAFLFLAMQMLLSRINELHFGQLQVDCNLPFVDFKIVPKQQIDDYLLLKARWYPERQTLQQTVNQLKTEIPLLNKKLTQIIQKFSSILPVSLCRETLAFCANYQAFENFTKSIDDLGGLLRFYMNELNFALKIDQKTQIKINKYQLNYYENKYYTFVREFSFKTKTEELINSIFDQLGLRISKENYHLVYPYTRQLFIIAPREMQELLLQICRSFPKEVEPLRFLPSLLLAIDPSLEFQIRVTMGQFLHNAIQICGWSQTYVHNLLLKILVNNKTNQNSEDILISYCQLPKEQQFFDYAFALRLFFEFKLVKPIIFLLETHDRFDEAVQMALDFSFLDIAKQISLRSENQEQLLLKVAVKKAQVENDLTKALQFVNKRIRIEDLLHQVKAKIDVSLKNEIKNSMTDYQVQIEALRSQIETSNSSTVQIQRDLEKLRKRFVYIQKDKNCCCCGEKLLSQRFCAFNCGHGYHFTCLLKVQLEHSLDCKKLLAITALMESMEKQYPELKEGKYDDVPEAESTKFLQLQKQREQILIQECVMCSMDINGLNLAKDNVDAWKF